MQTITIWHNPRCSKSREAVKLVEDNNNCESNIVKYLNIIPSFDEIKAALQTLEISPRELMRTKEAIYKELDLKNETDDDKLIEAMAQNPKLIERPVLFKGSEAIIGRPTSIIEAFLNS